MAKWTVLYTLSLYLSSRRVRHWSSGHLYWALLYFYVTSLHFTFSLRHFISCHFTSLHVTSLQFLSSLNTCNESKDSHNCFLGATDQSVITRKQARNFLCCRCQSKGNCAAFPCRMCLLRRLLQFKGTRM
jgi:hypothetical protein